MAKLERQKQDTSNELLGGLIERVTFHNDGSGFCVLRIKARGHKELVTVVGHAATVTAGEWITASGIWITASLSNNGLFALTWGTQDAFNAVKRFSGWPGPRGFPAAAAMLWCPLVLGILSQIAEL